MLLTTWDIWYLRDAHSTFDSEHVASLCFIILASHDSHTIEVPDIVYALPMSPWIPLSLLPTKYEERTTKVLPHLNNKEIGPYTWLHTVPLHPPNSFVFPITSILVCTLQFIGLIGLCLLFITFILMGVLLDYYLTTCCSLIFLL